MKNALKDLDRGLGNFKVDVQEGVVEIMFVFGGSDDW